MFTYAYKTSIRVFAWLLWCDIMLMTRDFWNNLLDALVWPIAYILVSGYILPEMGMADNYGAFAAVSMLIMMTSYMSYSEGHTLAADIDTNRSIAYELTLPLPYWLVYIKIALSYAFKGAAFNLPTLLVYKLVLHNSFSWTAVSWPKFLLIYLIASIFFGFFGAWSAVFAGSLARHTRIDLRVMGPLFFISGFQFPWSVLYATAPLMGTLMLATPWIYAYEGTRAAFLGQAGSLNYRLCLVMIVFFALLCALHGIYLFKKKLDCV
jgi:hypothetical protein